MEWPAHPPLEGGGGVSRIQSFRGYAILILGTIQFMNNINQIKSKSRKFPLIYAKKTITNNISILVEVVFFSKIESQSTMEY